MLNTLNIYLYIFLLIALYFFLHFCILYAIFPMPNCLIFITIILVQCTCYEFCQFCLHKNILFLSLNRIFTGCRRILDWKLFSFLILMMSFHYLLISIISYWKFNYHLIISHLKGICNQFSLDALMIFFCPLVQQFYHDVASCHFICIYLGWGSQQHSESGIQGFVSVLDF